jgi:hypothetical protein
MISTTSMIQALYNWREDKMALTCFTVLLVSENGSAFEAWEKLNESIPAMKEIADGSRGKGKNRKFPVNHDIAKRVLDIAEEIEPWIRQLAEREKGTKIGTLT